jgi:hypothetical protein
MEISDIRRECGLEEGVGEAGVWYFDTIAANITFMVLRV